MEWDFWTSSNDGCGNACDQMSAFKINMRETAQSLEKVIPLTGGRFFAITACISLPLRTQHMHPTGDCSIANLAL